MMNEIEVKAQFYEYLSSKFGDKFTDMIEPPSEAKIGERVLYVLDGSEVASRKEFDQKANEEFLQGIVGGIEGATFFTEPPVESGLPYARMVDITDWSEVAINGFAKEYTMSDDLLPKKDYTIKWLFGLCFAPRGNQLVHVDFTHPKVKTAFSADYELEYSFAPEIDMQHALKIFKEKRAKLIQEVESNPSVLWAKLVQLNGTTLSQIRTAKLTGNLQNL